MSAQELFLSATFVVVGLLSVTGVLGVLLGRRSHMGKSLPPRLVEMHRNFAYKTVFSLLMTVLALEAYLIYIRATDGGSTIVRGALFWFHLPCAVVMSASLVGMLWHTGLRNRKVHRRLSRVLLCSTLLAAPTGLWMLFYQFPA